MSIFIELLQFMKANKKLWMVPMVMTLVLLGALMIVTEGSAIAPFIYAVF